MARPRNNNEQVPAGDDSGINNAKKGKTYTSKAQFKMMVQLLEQNPGLANNTLKGSDVIDTWREFCDTLNSIGPSRDVSGWKKVLADFKSSIKRKLADNRKELIETGGGPNNMVLLTDIEERVAILTNMYAAVDGNEDTACFGAPSRTRTTMTPTTSSSTPSTCRKRKSYTLGAAYFNNGTSEEEEEDAGTTTVADKENEAPGGLSTPSGQSFPPTRKRAKNSESLSLLVKQVNCQETFNEVFDSRMDKLCSSVKDLAYNQRQMYKSLQNIEKLKSAKLEEFRRHNLAMEKLALDKLKVKKQILELELNRLSEN